MGFAITHFYDFVDYYIIYIYELLILYDFVKVKENRDKRLIEKERRLRELKSLKDSRHQARQIVQKVSLINW